MPTQPPATGWAFITLRRAEVLRELTRFKTEVDIAETLGISVAGVRSHLAQIKNATGYQTNRALARWWQSGARSEWANAMRQAAGCDFELRSGDQ